MKSVHAFYFLCVLAFSANVSAQSSSTTATSSGGNEGEENGGSSVNLDEQDEVLEEFDVSQSYCFKFTWMGPEFDNSTQVNTTCGQLMDDKRTENVPCKNPLVITDDSTPPDMDYLWDHHKLKVACRRAKGQVCAKYSYYFNKEVQNVTYMCTKVFAVDEGPVESGCYDQQVDGIDVKLCVCQSVIGDYKPCNCANVSSLSLILPFALVYFIGRNILRNK